MPLSKLKLDTYQHYYQFVLQPLREFDDGTGHPVVLFHESNSDKTKVGGAWLTVMCPCDLTFRFEKQNGERTLLHICDGLKCPAKAAFRRVVHRELREQHCSEWSQLPLVDVVHDIYKKHVAGAYVGEYNPGALYVQDIEALLGAVADSRVPQLGTTPLSAPTFPVPRKALLDAVIVLKNRKLIDLCGMILVPHRACSA